MHTSVDFQQLYSEDGNYKVLNSAVHGLTCLLRIWFVLVVHVKVALELSVSSLRVSDAETATRHISAR